MVIVPAFTYFFPLREGIEAKLLWPKKFAPKLRNRVNKIKVQNVIFIFLKQFLITFNRSFEYCHLNISVTFYYLSFFREARVGDKIPWPGQLAPWGEDTLAWAACPPPLETWQTQIRQAI